ncbi:hypothetical protein [Streptomyces physcomitrii]|uniref:Uncharacterized protein n=1 Tax=Streptomyces physcomitrii TaxID=2724184 RepID=A0ABX1GY33_9ACTN|nr:hypothetical protein [Streptomyces physcomitrii]NKI39721.1 hypothetical protein [Streptomyces physcomitrii]
MARERVRRRRRALALAAAAALLLVGGPLAVLAADRDREPAAAPGDAVPADRQTLRATDPKTRVTAEIGMEPRAWGTHTVLRLSGVRGPLTCSLYAIGVDGSRETVSTWAVPEGGYRPGRGGSTGGHGPDDRYPPDQQGGPDQRGGSGAYGGLNVEGGASYRPAGIDHFEVRTTQGRRLVTVSNP